MIRPGPRNLITDIDGIAVGNAEDHGARTGVTVVLPARRMMAAVDVRGGGPGTSDTDALDPSCLLDAIDGIVLSGGSVFGLEAAAGVTGWLARHGRGFRLGPATVPIVPGAVLFDLANGGDKGWGDTPPYRALAETACRAAGPDFALGNAGAGLGAKAGGLKGGLGSVSAVDRDSGLAVGAVVAANPAGGVVMPGQSAFWAWMFELDGELGGQTPPARPVPPEIEVAMPPGSAVAAGGSTVIGVVAANAALTKAEARRVAIMAQDGIARAVRPSHTAIDGDTLFVLATGALPLPEPRPLALTRIGAMAADAVARAIARGVFLAEGLGDKPGYRERHGSGR